MNEEQEILQSYLNKPVQLIRSSGYSTTGILLTVGEEFVMMSFCYKDDDGKEAEGISHTRIRDIVEIKSGNTKPLEYLDGKIRSFIESEINACSQDRLT